MNKPKWTLRMCLLADHWLQHSSCVRRQVGAVVFDPASFAVYGIGYNDTPIGQEDCGEDGCPACAEGSVRNRTDCKCVHAEMNAMILARRDLRGAWIAIAVRKDGHLTIKRGLCDHCRALLIQAGVTVWCQRQLGQGTVMARTIETNEVLVW